MKNLTIFLASRFIRRGINHPDPISRARAAHSLFPRIHHVFRAGHNLPASLSTRPASPTATRQRTFASGGSSAPREGKARGEKQPRAPGHLTWAQSRFPTRCASSLPGLLWILPPFPRAPLCHSYFRCSSEIRAACTRDERARADSDTVCVPLAVLGYLEWTEAAIMFRVAAAPRTMTGASYGRIAGEVICQYPPSTHGQLE